MTTVSEVVAKGYQARREGKLPLARQYYIDAAKLHREEGSILAYAHAIRHVADIHREEKNPASAKPLYEEVLEIYRSNLDTKLLDLANTVRPYALLIEEEGDFVRALTLWEEARNLYRSLRIDQGVTECSRHISHLQRE
jgi:tetratricopeptide (TPR) repeat protein